MTDLRFYLGTDEPSWLWRMRDTPLFVSHRRLCRRVSPFTRATTPWALDSGGFTELSLHGKWVTSPADYVTAVRRYAAELGSLEWASPQDWMCEPFMTNKTGLSVAEHQARTLENYLTLTEMAPDLPFIPVLQGWVLPDYHRHADAYAAAGVDLSAAPRVGVGSVCRRQGTSSIAAIFDSLHARGLRLHGFGVKSTGLASYADNLVSADSLAWSFGAWMASRKRVAEGRPVPACGKASCHHCPHFALEWRDRTLRRLHARQLALPLFGPM